MSNQPAKMWSGRFHKPLSYRLALTLLCGLFSMLAPTLANAQTTVQRSFTIRNIKLTAQEHITGIELKLSGAMFDQVSPLPKGWNITIDNDPSWNIKFSGSIYVGAAALDSSELSRLHFFITEDLKITPKFTMSGVIHVTDWKKVERDITITLSNLQFQERHSK